jgi:hypothetical protein
MSDLGDVVPICSNSLAARTIIISIVTTRIHTATIAPLFNPNRNL